MSGWRPIEDREGHFPLTVMVTSVQTVMTVSETILRTEFTGKNNDDMIPHGRTRQSVSFYSRIYSVSFLPAVPPLSSLPKPSSTVKQPRIERPEKSQSTLTIPGRPFVSSVQCDLLLFQLIPPLHKGIFTEDHFPCTKLPDIKMELPASGVLDFLNTSLCQSSSNIPR